VLRDLPFFDCAAGIIRPCTAARRDIADDPLLERRVGDQTLAADILPLQILQPPDRIDLKPTLRFDNDKSPCSVSALLLLPQCVQSPRPGANAAPEALQFIFLVRTVDAVVLQRKTCQHHIHAQLLFQFRRDRD